jgi:tetratricopeptide (TPR) repeat protein
MTSDTRFERARVLLQQGRAAEAKKQVGQLLLNDPNDAQSLWLLSLCESGLKNYDEALSLIRQALTLQPDRDLFMYAMSRILFLKDDLKQAEASVSRAISMNPNEASYFALLAAIRLDQKEYKQALEQAEEGLKVDPDNLECLNIRSTALVKLNRKADAFITINEALSKDPDNDRTHANYGWGLLEKGEHKKALEHFRESLKLNPGNNYAQSGMVEALKARYWFYRMFLKYQFWIANMKGRMQWVVILGFYFGMRFVKGIADSNPSLQPFLIPIIVLYTLFALSTWLTVPIANLFLRLNVYGRYALSKEEITSSNYVGIALLAALTGGVLALASAGFEFVLLSIYGVTMMIPLASMFHPGSAKSKRILLIYTVALAVLGAGGIVVYAFTGTLTVGIIYLVGIAAYQWVSNALAIRMQ